MPTTSARSMCLLSTSARSGRAGGQRIDKRIAQPAFLSFLGLFLLTPSPRLSPSGPRHCTTGPILRLFARFNPASARAQGRLFFAASLLRAAIACPGQPLRNLAIRFVLSWLDR